MSVARTGKVVLGLRKMMLRYLGVGQQDRKLDFRALVRKRELS